MTISDQLKLSCYRDIAELDADHGVYLVQHIKTKKVYVKKILTFFNYQIYLRLKNEPVQGMPAIMELVRDENLLIVIEQYCPGVTLQDMLNQNRSLPERDVILYMIQLCEILEKLHSLSPGIIHRDIKPSNIIISDEGKVYLIDINAAKYENALQARDTRLLGTEGYAAPEQYGFGSSTAQTDIYAVGMVMRELTEGRLSGNRYSTGALARVISRCTQIDPKDRFKSVSALKAALMRLPADSKEAGREENHRKYLPPGFRTLDPLHMLVAIVGYSGVLFTGLTLNINERDTAPSELLLYRVYTTFVMLLVILLSCNYMDVQSRFPPCRVQNPFLKLLGIVLLDLLAIVVTFIPFVVIMTILYP